MENVWWGGVSNFREGLSEKVTFKQRPEGITEASHMDGGKECSRIRNGKCKGQVAEVSPRRSRNSECALITKRNDNHAI